MLSAIVEVCCGFHLRPYKRWRRTLSRTLRRAIEGPSRSSFFGLPFFFLTFAFSVISEATETSRLLSCFIFFFSAFGEPFLLSSFFLLLEEPPGHCPSTWSFFFYIFLFSFFLGEFSASRTPPPPLTSSTGQMTWRFCFFFVLYYLHFIMEFYQLTCPCFLVWNLVWNLVFDFFFA